MFVGDLALSSLPDMLDRVVVWCIWWKVDQIEIFKLFLLG